MYMYLLLSMPEFMKFCTYNNWNFCPVIHNSSIQCPRTMCSIEKYNKFGCSLPHRSYAGFPAEL